MGNETGTAPATTAPPHHNQTPAIPFPATRPICFPHEQTPMHSLSLSLFPFLSPHERNKRMNTSTTHSCTRSSVPVLSADTAVSMIHCHQHTTLHQPVGRPTDRPTNQPIRHTNSSQVQSSRANPTQPSTAHLPGPMTVALPSDLSRVAASVSACVSVCPRHHDDGEDGDDDTGCCYTLGFVTKLLRMVYSLLLLPTLPIADSGRHALSMWLHSLVTYRLLPNRTCLPHPTSTTPVPPFLLFPIGPLCPTALSDGTHLTT